MDPIELLIVQPTPFCNLDCDYCYLPHRSRKALMSSETLGRVFSSVFQSSAIGERLTIVWHAGEPLTAPVSFYRHAADCVSTLKPASCDVAFNFQTNGTLIDDEWCALFADLNAKVGISLDGPRHIHDAQRQQRSGRGTFDLTVAGIERLKSSNIPFHIICVVTEQTLDFPAELYDFMRGSGCTGWGFNIESPDGVNRRRSFSSSERDPRLRAFIRKLFSLWMSDPQRPRIREFTGALGALASEGGARQQESRPFAIVNVDVNGNASTFTPELLGHQTHHGPFHFGNLASQRFDDLISSERFRRVSAEIDAGIEICRSQCEYYDWCGGGSPGSKFFETGRFDVSVTRSCQTAKMITLDEIIGVLEERAVRPFSA